MGVGALHLISRWYFKPLEGDGDDAEDKTDRTKIKAMESSQELHEQRGPEYVYTYVQ